MIQQLLLLVLIVITCYGCDNKSDNPKSTPHNAEDASTSPNPLPSQENTSSTTDNNDGRSSNLANRVDDQDRYISFPDVGIRLLRPDGFDDAKNFHGFQQSDIQSSMMALIIPGPFLEAVSGFTAERLKTRGMTLHSKENVEIDGNTGILLNVTQAAHGIEFVKWIITFGNEKETKMVTATFPQSHETILSAQLKSILLSAKSYDGPSPTPGADVGFTIAASDKMKLTRGMGKMLLYTKEGVIPVKLPEDPLFVAAPSLSNVPIQDKRQFSTQRLFQTANTKISSVTSINPIIVDGLDGYELIANASDVASGTPLVVYQVILFEDDSYILIQGLVGAKLSAEYLPEFKTMARSLARKPE